MSQKDYYSILGVGTQASMRQIRQAYRKLARQYHPDYNPGDQAAEEKIKELNEAYAVLSDPTSRRRYNLLKIGRHSSTVPTGGLWVTSLVAYPRLVVACIFLVVLVAAVASFLNIRKPDVIEFRVKELEQIMSRELPNTASETQVLTFLGQHRIPIWWRGGSYEGAVVILGDRLKGTRDVIKTSIVGRIIDTKSGGKLRRDICLVFCMDGNGNLAERYVVEWVYLEGPLNLPEFGPPLFLIPQVSR